MEKSGNPRSGSTQTVAVGRIVMNAIRKVEGSKGISLPGLKKFLRDGKKMDVVQHNEEIKMSLKRGIDKGLLMREDGNYMLKEAKRRRSRSKSPKKSRKRRSRSRSKGKKRSGRKGKSRSRKRSGSRKKRSKRRGKHAEDDGC